MKLLIANRGEIAIRIAQAAHELDIATVAVYADDDRQSLHLRRVDEAAALSGSGASAYLDIEQMIGLAKKYHCSAIHPGYGFLSENPDFAAAVAAAGLVFVGPDATVLTLFGDKTRAKALAEECGVPTVPGTRGIASETEVHSFLQSLPDGSAIVLKAVAGGGGRGLRIIRQIDELADAYQRCQSEARAAFGNGELYAEKLLPGARHIEVQIIGDGQGACNHLWDRDCSLQRRHQKLVEIAPAPNLDPDLRNALIEASLTMAQAVNYRNIGTFEYLLAADGNYAFIEANPRLQVEHTVTEAVTGVDLVQLQLQIALGHTLAELDLGESPAPARGIAIECRVNTEQMTATGQVFPTTGKITQFGIPSGPGVRVDSHGHVGCEISSRYDTLLAKVIVHSHSKHLSDAMRKSSRALQEFCIEGVTTNLDLLHTLMSCPGLIENSPSVSFIEDHLEQLAPTPTALATAVDSTTREIVAPMQGTLVELLVRTGDEVTRNQPLLIMAAMKMEHVITAPAGGEIQAILVTSGEAVPDGQVLLVLSEYEVANSAQGETETIDLEHIRPDLAEVFQRHAIGLDAARPEAMARRHDSGHRSTRENINELCDPGTFTEYGPLVIAAQRRRRSLEDLIARTPGDGMVAGIGQVNGELFAHLPEQSRQCVLMSYDYTVLAGTQGAQNHRKKDRMFELAEQWQLPLVFFTEGGGGRPGDTDGVGGSGLDCLAFTFFARLSGLVPLVGVTSGRCFAGNAALLGCCDVIIATADSNIGMGGPAMIEGGGLGVFTPEEIGPMAVQVSNGVVDIAVQDEQQAVFAAKKYLSYFQGTTTQWDCADQRLLRHIIPENRLRIYDVRRVVETLADTDSVLELRQSFGLGMVTALIRIEGRPLGVIANNPNHLAGAIDSDGADKAARFMQLCDAFDVPLLFLCDTPGIMVGPEAEKSALVRHAARMFLNGASLSIPFFTIVLRKGYGLGAQTMAGGSFKAPFFTVSWPTGEFGGMGLEGAVKLGYRKELAAQENEAARTALYEKMVARMYEHGRAVSTASYFMLDDVIDPMQSRDWILTALKSAHNPAKTRSPRRPCIDSW